MTITQKHWSIAVIAAFSLHALAALPLLLAGQAKVEVQPDQGGGIAIGLGGDFGAEGDGSLEAADGPVADEIIAVAEPVRQLPLPAEAPPEEVREVVQEPVPEVVQEPVVEAIAVEVIEQPAAVDAIVVEQPAAALAEPAQAVATLAHADNSVPASDAQAIPVVARHQGHSSQGQGGRGGKGGNGSAGGRGGTGIKGYFHKVAARIDSHKEYPDAVKKQKFEGKVIVAFVIGRSGELLDSSIRKSSGNKLLDQAALDTLARASPFPPLPKSLKRESLKISVPIAYTLINN